MLQSDSHCVTEWMEISQNFVLDPFPVYNYHSPVESPPPVNPYGVWCGVVQWCVSLVPVYMHVAFIDSLCKCIPCTLFPSQSPSHPAGHSLVCKPSYSLPRVMHLMTSNDNCSSPTLECSCGNTSPECQQSHYSQVVVCPILGAGLEMLLWWTWAPVSDGTAHQPIVGVYKWWSHPARCPWPEY